MGKVLTLLMPKADIIRRDYEGVTEVSVEDICKKYGSDPDSVFLIHRGRTLLKHETFNPHDDAWIIASRQSGG